MGKDPKNSERRLLEELSSGSIDAFEQLFLKYYGGLRQFIAALTRDDGMAEDLVQDIFIKLWLGRTQIRPGVGTIRPWLFTVARNASLNYLRARCNTMTTVMSRVPEASDNRTPEDAAAYTEARLKLAREVARMPSQRQKVFKMSRYENLTLDEIALRLGISPRTAEKHLELALKELRETFN